MDNAKWVEIKREDEINENGEFITTKKTLEPFKKKYWGLEKKDIIDTTLRFIGLAAIFLPLWLFYQQQNAERNKQRALFQMDVYSKTVTELHSLLNKPICSQEFEKSNNIILFDMYPKLVLLGDKAVIDTFKSVKSLVEFSSIVCSGFRLSDSLYNLTYSMEQLVVSPGIPTKEINMKKSDDLFFNTYMQIYNLLPRLDNVKYNDNSLDTANELKLFSEAFHSTFLDLKVKASSYSSSFMKFKSNNVNNFKLENIEFYDLQYEINRLKNEYTEYYTRLLNNAVTKLDAVIIKSSILSSKGGY